MIKELVDKDRQAIYQIINKAAEAYDGKIPGDCYHQPYMSEEELNREMNEMRFFGWEEDGKLVGAMAIQHVKDVTLIRHAYVLPEYQGKGIGTTLLDFLKSITGTKDLLVGTWADATWAIKFYEKHGFKLMSDPAWLLGKYWNIPERQVQTSVVLGTEVA